jgi:hypothetical protein
MNLIDRLKTIEDPVKRRALFIGLLTQEVKRRGGKEPIVVGGLSLEIYTQGSYTTGDIDIKAQKDILEAVLKGWGFIKKGRIWVNEYLDIYIDWLGSSLDEGPLAEERVNTIIVGDDLEVKIISIEDLIIDRLNAVKFWKDEDSLIWAKVLVKVKEATGEPLDREYLKERALKEGTLELLEEILKT